jgi:hypothetical protein
MVFNKFPLGEVKSFWRWMAVTDAQLCVCTGRHTPGHVQAVRTVNIMSCVFSHTHTQNNEKC